MVETPNGFEAIPNPLVSYRFHPPTPEVFTGRSMPPEDVSLSEIYNVKMCLLLQLCVNICPSPRFYILHRPSVLPMDLQGSAAWATRKFSPLFSSRSCRCGILWPFTFSFSLRDRTYNALTYNNDFNHFATKSWPQGSSGGMDTLESVHDTIHVSPPDHWLFKISRWETSSSNKFIRFNRLSWVV